MVKFEIPKEPDSWILIKEENINIWIRKCYGMSERIELELTGFGFMRDVDVKGIYVL